ANSLYNALYRAKISAIVNLYNTGFIVLDNRNYMIFLDLNRNNNFDNNIDTVILNTRNIINDFNNRNSFIQSINISSNNLDTTIINFNPNNVIFRFNSLGFVNLPNNNNFNFIDFNLVNNRVRYRYVIRLIPGGDINIRKIMN
ncbi:MAG: hypothetical protein ACP5O4_07475, partial [bacterium]